MKLSSIKPAVGSTKKKKRLGRGVGSGSGGTASRGNKGAKSRSGYHSKPGFEGGQMPLYRRVPKFGFKNNSKIEFKPINLDVLQELAKKTSASVIDSKVLYENGLMGKTDKVKILGRGELKSKIEVKANAFSASAIAAIEKAGGKATIV